MIREKQNTVGVSDCLKGWKELGTLSIVSEFLARRQQSSRLISGRTKQNRDEVSYPFKASEGDGVSCNLGLRGSPVVGEDDGRETVNGFWSLISYRGMVKVGLELTRLVFSHRVVGLLAV